MDINSNHLYTIGELAHYLRINYRNALQLVHQKRIKSIKIGNLYRVSGLSINTFLKENHF